jgi:predicted PurR-regulated permease PerM
MTRSRYWAFVLTLVAVFVLVLLAYMFQDILAPFIVAFIFAYVSKPLVAWFEKRGMSRAWAAAAATAVLILLFAFVILLLGPLLYEQLMSFLKALPRAFENLLSTIQWRILPFVPEPFRARLQEMGASGGEDGIGGMAVPLASSLISGGAAVLIWVGLAILTPVILYYLLKEWPNMMQGFFTFFPDDQQEAVHKIIDSIDQVMSGFLRGQAWVCLVMAVFYSTGLMIAGLEYALLIGILSGLMKYLPYIGTAISVLLAVSVGLTQEGSDLYLMLGVAITYGVGEVLESSFLTPNFVGTQVNLSPAVVIFAVLLGGKFFGILGVFVAAPVFASMRILLHYALFNDVPVPSNGKPAFKLFPRRPA